MSNLSDYESHMRSVRIYLEERLKVSFHTEMKNVTDTQPAEFTSSELSSSNGFSNLVHDEE